MSLFIELLQVSLGTREKLSRVPNAREWELLFEAAEIQAIVGILLTGLERLPSEQLPPLEVKLQWIGEVQIIEQQNRVVSKACREVVEQLEKDGFKCCVLKGQANLRYYPEEMRLRRSCGDIDIWVRPNEAYCLQLTAYKNPVRTTLEYVEREHELTGLCWLHCNFDYSEDVPVEVHFRPSFMNEPIHNHRLQQWFGLQLSSLLLNNKEHVLPVDVDVVYQMNHIYRHLLDEGVGLRQIVDYYYCLKAYCLQLKRGHTDNTDNLVSSFKIQDSGLFEHELSRINHIIKNLGMKRFAGALMYVMKEVCGMSDEELLCEPNEKYGKFLQNEIMTAGNFGQADPRMGELNTSSLLKRQVSQAWRRFKRNMRFVTSYPGEVIWEPCARIYHFSWKKMKLYKV